MAAVEQAKEVSGVAGAGFPYWLPPADWPVLATHQFIGRADLQVIDLLRIHASQNLTLTNSNDNKMLLSRGSSWRCYENISVLENKETIPFVRLQAAAEIETFLVRE